MKINNTKSSLGNVEFDNVDRKRYYGIRKGDIVEQNFYGTKIKGEVVGYGFLDNNAVYVDTYYSRGVTKFVAEWCTVITKVEDRK